MSSYDLSNRETQDLRDSALAYAVQSAEAPDPDAIVATAEKFFDFLAKPLSDKVTEDNEIRREVTELKVDMLRDEESLAQLKVDMLKDEESMAKLKEPEE